MEEPSGGHAAPKADGVTRFTAEAIAVRQRRAGAWILIALGVGCILFGGVFFAVKHSGHNVVATVTHEGPCSNGTCTVDVVYDVAGGPVTAVMYGVISSEIHGPPGHRLLNITYQPGSEGDPTTNDMPDGVWIGFGAAGLAFVGWGAWLRLRPSRPRRELTVAAAGGAPADVAVPAAMASAVTDQPGPRRPAGISGRGPIWVSDESGAITIAERYPRWWAVILTLFVAILPALMFPPLLSFRHPPAAVAYLVIATAVAVWGCSRAWPIGLRFGDDGLTVRNHCRTYRIGWPEVCCFADGSVNRGESGRFWALGIELRDGRVVTASGTASGKRNARPETLTAIEQAAGRYAIPAELTGTAGKRGSRESPANAGLYPDPGGQPGLRRWDGRHWSPFLLRADPASGKPEGTRPAEVWAPLTASEPQWHDAAASIRRVGKVFVAWLGVTAVAAAATMVLYARDLSKPQADFTLAVFALIAAAFALTMTCSAWARRKNLKKIDQAGKAAVGDAGAHAAGRPGDAGSGLQMTAGDICAPGWAAGMPLPSEVSGGFSLPADVTGAAPSPRRRRIIPLTAAAVSIVAAVAVTTIVLGKTAAQNPAATQAATPAAARTPAPEPAPAPQPLLIRQLRPGDCLQGPPGVNTARWWPHVVMAVPCTQKHLAEVYFFSAHYWPKAMAFPGRATMVRQAKTECRKEFQSYDGDPSAVSLYSFRDISPWDRVNWSFGDRLLLCTAYYWADTYPRGVPLYASIKGSYG